MYGAGMRRLVVSSTSDAASVREAVEILRGGGIVAYPTDTLYGLAVDPRQIHAVERLFALKGRQRASAVPLIAGTIGQARLAGTFGPLDLQLAAAFWPGPLALVTPA